MTSRAYEVRTCTTEQLFGGSAPVFVVPEFQRGYAWDVGQVEELVDDLFPADNLWIHKSVEDDRYFLGSLVIARSAGGDRVLDGQQRLTTLSLLIAVLRDRALANGQDAAHLEGLLRSARFGEAKQAKVTLQSDDRAIYESAIDRPAECASGPHRRSRIARSTGAAIEAIDGVLARQTSIPPTELVRRMIRRLLYGVELVEIAAPDEAMAYRLFETLNDRGMPLNAADLIKNKLFMLAKEHLPAVRAAWEAVLDLVGVEEILQFLRHFAIASEGRSVSKHRLYEAFDASLPANLPEVALKLAQDLQAAASLYGSIARPRRELHGWTAETTEVLERLGQLRARSCRSALLACARRAPTDFKWFAATCESAVVRHTVVGGKNPNQLEAAYAQICHELKAGQNVRAAAAKAFGAVVPGDDAFRSSFAELTVPNVSTATRVLLLRLNDLEGTAELRVDGPSKVHVEHVFPRTPSEAALKESSVSREDAGELAEHIGNLTLLSSKLNITISNGPFSSKRPEIAKSQIALNTSIAREKRWTREVIVARAERMAKLAVGIWAWPEELARQPAAAPSAAAPVQKVSRAARPSQLALPIAARKKLGFPSIASTSKLNGSVWIPRILWALERAHRFEPELGRAKTAAQLARILTTHSGIKVQETNMARAFRDLREQGAGLWSCEAGKYSLREPGRELFRELFEPAKIGSKKPEDHGASRAAAPAAQATPSGRRRERTTA